MEEFENLALNLLIVGSAVVLVPFLFVLIFSFIKFKSTKNIGLYIYALTSSMLIILGSFGFLREALAISEDIYVGFNSSIQTIIIMAIIVGGALFGIIASILTRFVIIKKNSHIHQSHITHDHNDHIFNLRDIDNVKNKWSAIILLLNHRIIESLALGVLLVSHSHDGHSITSGNGYEFPIENLGFIIIFIVHMIPEAIFIYQRQIEMGITRRRALINSFIMKLIIIPIAVFGAFVLQAIPNNLETGWILPFLFATTGSILIFVSIIELVPEFIDNKNMSNKTWFTVIGFFTFGILFAITLSLLHIH